MTRTKTILLSSIAVLALSTLANADPAADTNKDGVITRAEFMAAAQAKFDGLDLNQDGYISKNEREDVRQIKNAERRSEHFNRIDTNADGVISRNEFENQADLREDSRKDGQRRRHESRNERMEKLKEMADIDGDGEISESERRQVRERFESGREGRRERQQEFRERRGANGPEGPGGRDPLARIDTNGDELISSQEYMAGAEKMFEHLDANDDGQLEKGEGRRHKRRSPGRGR